MSFSKAKINRYYDDVSCAPPPGKYDPKFDSKTKSIPFDKGIRFSTPKLEHASSVESLDSCCSSKTPVFRTPSKLKSKKGPFTTPRSRNLSSRMVLPDKLHPNQLIDGDQRLVDEINELTRVHQNQLIGKNEEIAILIDQVNDLNEKMSTLLLTQVTSTNKNEYETEINKLKKELIELQMAITSNNENYKNQVDCLNSQISSLEENISNHISINKDLENSLCDNNLVYEEINIRISEMANDFTLQLNKYVESMNKMEEMNKCLFEDYQCTLEILKKETDDNLSNKQMLVELQESLNNYRDDLSHALKRCKMYEVVQTETSKTINVLSKRLMESEVEVDHLNDVQQDLILKKNRLEEQVKGLSEENQTIRDSLDLLKQSFRLEVESMQDKLLQKVDAYKQFAVEESEKQKSCIEEKQKTINMLLAEIDFYKNRKTEVDSQLSSCLAKVAFYQEEISTLKTALTDLEKNCTEQIGAQKALFSQLSEEYESLKNLSAQEKHRLEKKVLKLSQTESILQNECTEKASIITNLENDMKIVNDQLCQSQHKIKHLESLTYDYDGEIDKITVQLEEKTKIIENLEKINIKIETERSDLNKEKYHLIESLSLKEQEYSLLEQKYKTDAQSMKELKKNMKIIQENNKKYTDEIMSELASEKRRALELTNAVADLKMMKKESVEENFHLKNIVSRINKEQTNNSCSLECDQVKRTLKELQETVQLFEYERLAQALSFDEYLEQKDELLKIIERQNREIDALSETVDRHYSARRELEQEISKLYEEKEQLKETGKEDSMKLTSLEARIADLECRNRELIDIIGPFRNELMQYEQERSRLQSKSDSTEKELRDLQLEHAKSLGHQNHKQKIKHIVNLNQKIAGLKKDLEKYRQENIKLKLELSSKKPRCLTSVKKNKENKTNTQHKERNTSPATALKDRNG